MFRNCLRCGDFLTTSSCKVKHDFLKHYEQGQDSIFEDKSLEIKNNNQILKYEISVEKFGELNITTSTILKNLLNDFFFVNTRYWSMETYRATYFNDYVFYSLKQTILSKVIANGMIGSSWRFNRFVSINLSVLKSGKEIVR